MTSVPHLKQNSKENIHCVPYTQTVRKGFKGDQFLKAQAPAKKFELYLVRIRKQNNQL